MKAIVLIFQDEWFSMEGNSPALFTVEPDYHSLQGDLPIQLFMLRVHCGYQLVCSDSSHCTSGVANVLICFYPPNVLKEKSNVVGNVFVLPYYMLSDGKTDMGFISCCHFMCCHK